MIGMAVEAVQRGQDAEIPRGLERCGAGCVHADDGLARYVRQHPAGSAIEIFIGRESDLDEKTPAPGTRSATTCSNSGSTPTPRPAPRVCRERRGAYLSFSPRPDSSSWNPFYCLRPTLRVKRREEACELVVSDSRLGDGEKRSFLMSDGDHDAGGAPKSYEDVP
jgi:hypothetical protein